MKQELWLSRDEDGDGDYNIHEGEPAPKESGRFMDYDLIICSELLHKYVEGARLRKGRKKRIKRIVIELED